MMGLHQFIWYSYKCAYALQFPHLKLAIRVQN